MIICIDIDYTIAKPKEPYRDELFLPLEEFMVKLAIIYNTCELIPGAREKINEFRKAGYKIILWTARTSQYKTVTLNWLKRKGIFYNEIIFDKPRADLYIDDKAIRFSTWDNVEGEAKKWLTKLEK